MSTKVKIVGSRTIGQGTDTSCVVDSVTGALRTTSPSESRLYSGESWIASYRFDAAVKDVPVFLLPDTSGLPAGKMVTASITVRSGGDCDVDIYKNPVITSTGVDTALEGNGKVSQTNPSGIVIYTNPTVSSNGTKTYEDFIPGGSSAFSLGGSVSILNLVIDGASEPRLISITNRSGVSNSIAVVVNYFIDDE